MRYNARKKVSIYILEESFGEYGEEIICKKHYYTGTELVCPMTSSLVKKEYGIDSTSPKKVILNKSLPKEDVSLILNIEGVNYSVLERTDFDKFNILLIDIDRREYVDGNY